MINFEDGNKGTWFYFDENEDIGGICLRILDSAHYEKIEKLTVKHRVKFSHGQKYDDVKTDEEMASRLRWDYCIVDWTGIQIDGENVECDKKNKLRLIEIPDFIKLITGYLETLNEDNAALEEARLGNLKDTSSGDAEKTD